MSLLRARTRRGFALADFIAGSLILSATITAFVAMSRAKFQVLHAVEQLQVAQTALEAEADALRARDAISLPDGEPDAEGFVTLEAFEAPASFHQGEGAILLRPLQVSTEDADADARGLYEARLTLTWIEEPNVEASRITRVFTTVVEVEAP